MHGAFSHTLCGSIGAVQPKFSAEVFLESTRMTSPWPKVTATWYPESGLPCLSGDCGLISKWIKCVILTTSACRASWENHVSNHWVGAPSC